MHPQREGERRGRGEEEVGVKGIGRGVVEEPTELAEEVGWVGRSETEG